MFYPLAQSIYHTLEEQYGCYAMPQMCIRDRNLMQQLLKPAEGTEEAADKTPQQHAQQNEKACDIVGEAELGRAHHCLKRPDRAGPGRCRTGVAVQPRHADSLPRPLIQSALEKVRQMQVRCV